MFIRRFMFSTNRGLYTVEGACTIIIFTALIMMLLSIITVIETEVAVQNAINQTAMQLSQYSYAVGNEVNIESDEEASLKGIIGSFARETVGFTTGSAVCETLTRDRIDEKSLNLVDGGFSGLNFSVSNVLGDGKTITVIVIYKINVNTFGLTDKSLNICQQAKTAAWLPYYAETLAAEGTGGSSNSSIWKDSNFSRGQYFVKQEKEKYKENSVKSGQGIDLYFKETGKTVEIYSLNVFSSTYSYNSGDSSNPSDYSPKSDGIKKTVYQYVKDYKKDISNCGGSITMESGAEERFSAGEKELIIVVPNEAKSVPGMDEIFNEMRTEIASKNDINLKIVYSEDAL